MKKRILMMALVLSIGMTTLGASFCVLACPNCSQVAQMETNACHKMYPKLVEALQALKAKGVITDSAIQLVHEYYGKMKDQLPAGDEKALLESLYQNKLLSKEVYEQLKQAIK